MAATDLAAHDAVINDLFDKDAMHNLLVMADPFYALIPKETTWEGDKWKLALQSSTNQSVGGTFADAQAVLHSNVFKTFEVEPEEYFGFVTFTRRFIKQAKGAGAAKYVEGVKNEWGGLMETLQMELGFQAFNSLGVRGQISAGSTVGSKVITLADTRDALKFCVGMQVSSSATAGTGGSENAGHVIITSIDIDAGTLTTTASDWDVGITGCAASDYLFRHGDYGKGLSGLPSWIPATAPTGGDSHHGIDRSVDVVRLAGHRLAAGALSNEEAIRTMGAMIAKLNGKPSHAFMNLDRWTALENEMTSMGIKDFKERDATFGFKTISIDSPRGEIKCVGSPFCDYLQVFVTQMDTWKMKSAGGAPEIFKDDGLTTLRAAAANTYEGRAGWIAEIGCKAPGKNGIITFS